MAFEVVYDGVFFDFDEFQKTIDLIAKDRLAKKIKKPHVTFEFKPQTWEWCDLVGKKASFYIVGYADDGKNQGVSVKLKSADPDIKRLYAKIPVPHITISVSEDGKPKDTSRLDFKPISKKIELIGTFDAVIG